MQSALTPCLRCDRHLRATELVCPFCGVTIVRERERHGVATADTIERVWAEDSAHCPPCSRTRATRFRPQDGQ